MNNDFLKSAEYEVLRSSIDIAVKNQYSEKEEELKVILQGLMESGYLTTSSISQLEKDLAQELYEAMMKEMVSAYSQDDINNLINAVQTGLNDAQMTELFLRLYSKNTGKDLELYAVEIIEGFIDQLIIQFKLIEKTLEDVENISDDQAVIITNLLNEGLLEDAEKKLAEFKNQDGNTSNSSNLPSSLPKEDLEMLHQLLKNNYVEEAKQVLDKLLGKV